MPRLLALLQSYTVPATIPQTYIPYSTVNRQLCTSYNPSNLHHLFNCQLSTVNCQLLLLPLANLCQKLLRGLEPYLKARQLVANVLQSDCHKAPFRSSARHTVSLCHISHWESTVPNRAFQVICRRERFFCLPGEGVRSAAAARTACFRQGALLRGPSIALDGLVTHR